MQARTAVVFVALMVGGVVLCAQSRRPSPSTPPGDPSRPALPTLPAPAAAPAPSGRTSPTPPAARTKSRLFEAQDLGLLEAPDRDQWQKADQIMDALSI